MCMYIYLYVRVCMYECGMVDGSKVDGEWSEGHVRTSLFMYVGYVSRWEGGQEIIQ